MRSISLICIIMFISVLALTSSVNAQQEIPEDIYNAAQENLETFKEITGRNDKQKVEIASGYKVYALNTKILMDNEYESIMDLLEETNKWQFILSSNGKADSYLTIKKSGDEISNAGFGDGRSNLNGIYQKIVNNKNITNPVFVEVPPSSYILYGTPSGKYELIDFSSKNGHSIKSEDLLNDVKERIQNLGKDTGSRGFSSGGIANSRYINHFSLTFIVALIIFLSFIIFYYKKHRKKAIKN